MDDKEERLISVINHYQSGLERYVQRHDFTKMLHSLGRLSKLPIKVSHLEKTGVGRTVNSLRKLEGEVGETARSLVAKWKEMVEREDEESKAEESSCDEDEVPEKPSHKKETKQSKENKQERKSRRDRSSSSSSNEPSPKRSKTHKEKEHKLSRSKSEKDHPKSTKHESRHKHKSSHHKKDRSSDKHKSKEESKKKSHKTKKEEPSSATTVSKPGGIKLVEATQGICSESGTSFADALGMCEPKATKKKKQPSSTIQDRSKETSPIQNDSSVDLPVPKEPLEHLDINLSSLLPSITPHYRPLGLPVDDHHKKMLTDDEALSRAITNKNQRTKVYSGNKVSWGKLPSLFDMCVRILQDNIDALEYTGGVPYSILKPILEKATPNQLYMMEHHNPYLIEDSDELWKLHCQSDFRNKSRDELESWREMYMRCLDEREAKLKALTASIKQSQDKSLPLRTTKLAYVDSVAKPPRNIARKQMKNDTAKPMPSMKLASIAAKGDIAVPNPGARAAERSSHQTIKPKKAPLMAKTLSLFKNRFRR